MSTVFAITVVAILVKHVLGGVNYALIKVFMDTKASWLLDEGVAWGKLPKFGKALYSALQTFVSGWIVILPFFLYTYVGQRKALQQGLPLKHELYSWKNSLSLLIPASFDFIGVNLSMACNDIGLDASMQVAVKATKILFSALLSRVFLKTTIKPYHWVAIALVIPGVGLVGLADNVVQGTKEDSISLLTTITGVGLALLAEFFKAGKNVYEEGLLKDRQMCPRFISVIEGASCTLLSLLCMVLTHFFWAGKEYDEVVANGAVGSGFASKENMVNTWNWFTHSHRIQIWALYLFFTTGFISFFGLLVTKNLSAMHSAIFAEMRVVIVWVTELLIYLATSGIVYADGNTHPDGKKLHAYSWITVVGFALLILSGFVFNKKVRVPFMQHWYKEENHQNHPKIEDDEIKTPSH